MVRVSCKTQGLIASQLDLMDDATVATFYHIMLPISLPHAKLTSASSRLMA